MNQSSERHFSVVNLFLIQWIPKMFIILGIVMVTNGNRY
ncbi:putative membrane protein [Anaplasma phagocytophilum str. ApWI1]|uniref:Putative membrane protein n=2 Tax=Anaplasma phagocytophilum TaxID=948 RepID=A0A0F3NEH3_ANAPH|nr:putative membrane protein [Anaplasma phagocytophilum str. NCH-1]KJV83619.1 putative membrane protein [Anaplasma phagocytophilum str. HGE2]KJV85368.1 putative membrane protein [Anaplasma phagocytophilum str. ApWI1]KKA00801.1 putative membrane protein [Anaplasma phagocytophilum str. CR1007]